MKRNIVPKGIRSDLQNFTTFTTEDGIELFCLNTEYYDNIEKWKPHISILKLGELKQKPEIYSKLKENQSNNEQIIKILKENTEGVSPISNITTNEDLKTLLISYTDPKEDYLKKYENSKKNSHKLGVRFVNNVKKNRSSQASVSIPMVSSGLHSGNSVQKNSAQKLLVQRSIFRPKSYNNSDNQLVMHRASTAKPGVISEHFPRTSSAYPRSSTKPTNSGQLDLFGSVQPRVQTSTHKPLQINSDDALQMFNPSRSSATRISDSTVSPSLRERPISSAILSSRNFRVSNYLKSQGLQKKEV